MPSHINRMRPHWETAGRIISPIAAFFLVGLVVMGTSRAAFFDTTQNPGSSFASGDVVLTDDDSGAAMFSVANLAPGDVATECIVVTYEGSLTPARIELYVEAGDLAGTGLDDYLDMTVELGTGGSFGDCTGFAGATVYTGDLDGFAASYTNFAGGISEWTAAATDDDRTYRFSFTLQDDNAAQDLSATVTFTWEAQSQ